MDTTFGFVSLASCLSDELVQHNELYGLVRDSLNWHNNIILDWKRRPATGDWSANKAKYFDSEWRFSLPYDSFVLETYNEADGSCNVFCCWLMDRSLTFHHSCETGGKWLCPPTSYKLTFNESGTLTVAMTQPTPKEIVVSIYNLLLDRISYFNSCPGDAEIKVHCPSATNERINTRRRKSNKKPVYEFKVAFVDSSPAYPRRPYQGGSHASPTMHKRRGHFRKHFDKEIWIESCIVGLAKNGVTEKAYVAL